MNKILVTGGTGFIGSYLIRLLLREGYQVRALRRPSSRMDLLGTAAGQVEWVDADVTDIFALEEAFTGITHVFHCAALVSFQAKDDRRMRQVNVDGTANIVNLCLDFGIQQLIHLSSIAALGRSPERTHLDENSKWVASKQNTRYAISKYQGEQEVWRGGAEGLKVAVVSPAVVIGSGFWDEGSARSFQQVYQGLKFYPSGRTGMADVRDVARFMLLLMQQGISGERYILSAGDVELCDFFYAIAREMDKTPPFIKVNPFLAEVAWRVEWLKSTLTGGTPLLTRESARNTLLRYTYGNQKSLTVRGFSYRPLEDSIREIALQCQEAAGDDFSPRVLPV